MLSLLIILWPRQSQSNGANHNAAIYSRSPHDFAATLEVPFDFQILNATNEPLRIIISSLKMLNVSDTEHS